MRTTLLTCWALCMRVVDAALLETQCLLPQHGGASRHPFIQWQACHRITHALLLTLFSVVIYVTGFHTTPALVTTLTAISVSPDKLDSEVRARMGDELNDLRSTCAQTSRAVMAHRRLRSYKRARGSRMARQARRGQAETNAMQEFCRRESHRCLSSFSLKDGAWQAPN